MNELLVSDFAAFVRSTWKTDDEPHDTQLAIAGLGLAGEAGESVEHIKKYLRDGKPIDGEFALELGDVLYYVFTLARLNNMTVEDIMYALVAKLNKRREKAGKARFELEATGVSA